MTEPDNTQPVAIDYALGVSDYPAHRSPAVAMQYAWGLTGVALAISAAVLLTSGAAFIFACGFGLLASIGAFFCAGVAILQNRNLPRDSPMRLSMGRSLPVVVAAFVLMQFCGWSCAQIGDRITDRRMSSHVTVQLRDIAAAVRQYRQTFSYAPNDLNALVHTGLLHQSGIDLWTDPAILRTGRPGSAPSCIFIPQAAAANAPPSDILAYERGPWSADGLRLLPRRLHAVVFANGATARLTPADLAAALGRQQSTSSPRP